MKTNELVYCPVLDRHITWEEVETLRQERKLFKEYKRLLQQIKRMLNPL